MVLPTMTRDMAIVPENLSIVYFRSRSAKLTVKAKAVLDRQVGYLTRYPATPVDLEGHVDWVEVPGTGTAKEQAEMELAQSRAFAVKRYLVSKGIAKERLFIRGYDHTAIFPKNLSEADQRTLRYVMTGPHNPPAP